MHDPLESDLPRLMQEQAVPGLSLASLRAGRADRLLALGRRGGPVDARVDAHTVFEAASLTKPLVAYLALQLVDAGRLDLDEPLAAVCGEYVPGDAAAREITARHLLSHTSGLPNQVQKDTPLRTYFAPGSRFSYGSTGFGYLQLALERIAGQGLEALARRRLFEPLGMVDSSLEWQSRFDANHAAPHDEQGRPLDKRRPQQAHASWSLQTTAADYLQFVRAVLVGQDLSALSTCVWFLPVAHPPGGGNAEDLAGARPLDRNVAWGLGWGLEPAPDCFFHWGHNPGFRAFVLASRASGDAVVWFANAAGGLRFAQEILAATVPGEHPALDWMQLRH